MNMHVAAELLRSFNLVALGAILSVTLAVALAIPLLMDAISSLRRRFMRKQRTMDGLTEPITTALWLDLIRNGFPLFRAPASWLLRLLPWQSSCRLISQNLDNKAYPNGTQQISELLLAGCLTASLAVWLISGEWLIGSLLGLLLPYYFYSVEKSRLQKRNQRMREQLPDALQCLGFCFLAGCTLQQAIQQTAQETSEPLRRELIRTSDDLQSGLPVKEALAALEYRNQLVELSFLAVALEIQHQTGGSLKDLLESAAESVRTAVALKRQLQVQTAQARLSFKVVALMPLILVLVLSLTMDGYLATFYSSLEGFLILILAIGMELSGILMIRRILGVDLG